VKVPGAGNVGSWGLIFKFMPAFPIIELEGSINWALCMIEFLWFHAMPQKFLQKKLRMFSNWISDKGHTRAMLAICSLAIANA